MLRANEATFRVVMYDGGAVFELLCTGIAKVVPPRKHGTRRTRRHRAFKDIFSFDGRSCMCCIIVESLILI